MPPRELNQTRAPFPREDIPALFDLQAMRRPEAVAIRDRGKSIRYGELRLAANRLASCLRLMGVGPGDRVGLCTDRSADLVIGLLGILKAGAAYVPLDPNYPKDRLAFMLTDTQVAALISQSLWRDALPDIGVPTLLLDSDRARIAAEPSDPFASGATGDNLAYIIYTSGSTGTPKGVAIRRDAFMNFLWAMKHRLEIGERDAFLALATICFDIAGMEIFLPLIVGARVVLATRDDATEARRLARLLAQERVTVAQATPASWRMLLDSPWPGAKGLQILCGGEPMTRALADRLLTKCARLWNVYGPTETTVWGTLCPIVPGDETISIGRPIENATAHVLDEHLAPVATGQVGELYIGGVGLAWGYFNRPDLTAERFIPDPFSEEPGARMYRTGDLARAWPDGRLECLGRVDHQVKVRGFRIELPEIEARLGAHPELQAAAVLALDDGHGDKYLAAYWAARPDSQRPAEAAELERFVAEKLPRHMVPSVFVRMDALPLTPNGKIDRRALPAPDHQARWADRDVVEPAGDTERRLVRIWESLLGIQPIGTQDDFFALGGHSLTAARIVARIESEMSIAVPVATLLSSPTIQALARVLDGEVEDEHAGVVVRFRQTGSRPPLFLVAGVGGHVLIFRELAGLLGNEQPVYGLQGIGLDGKEPPLTQMEQIARRYIREIVTIQPEGPYLISGWSMGGVIAYEMARQLLDAGMPLARLIVIDAYAPWVVPLADRARIHLASFRQRSLPDKMLYVAQRLTHQFEVLARRLGFDRGAEGLDGPIADRVKRSSLAQFEALRRYRPGRLAAEMTLLRAEQTAEIRDPRSLDPHLGWSGLVDGQIRVLPIHGSHTGIFVGRNVTLLAAALQEAINLPARAVKAGTEIRDENPPRTEHPSHSAVISWE